MKNEEIKEILDKLQEISNYAVIYNIKINSDEAKILLDYITNLQQDLDKSNNIIEKDRQFYKCRMDEYAELKKENEDLKTIIKQYVDIVLHDRKVIDDYKSRTNKAIEYIKDKGLYEEELDIFNDDINYNELDDLLNILNGGNNNEYRT